jgi:hypothetical protein
MKKVLIEKTNFSEKGWRQDNICLNEAREFKDFSSYIHKIIGKKCNGKKMERRIII